MAERSGEGPLLAAQIDYGQFTQAAESTDGLHFKVRPAITKDSRYVTGRL